MENRIPSYINDWLDIIESMQNDNTYKPCFGRALFECINNKEFKETSSSFIIDIDLISENMIRYYWNQLFFFNLKQSANNKKPPVICQIVNEMINVYKINKNSSIPAIFDLNDSYKIKTIIGEDYYKKCVKKVSKVIPENVLYRFRHCNGEVKEIYDFDLKEKTIIFDKNNLVLILSFNVILSKLLNYKWAQLLEKYNNSPRIVNKVHSISINKIKRNNLTKYKEQLLKQFEDGHILDFYTGLELDKNDISIDHVIPWSFMYSNDIWNLVVTSKSNNSKKSNSIPSKDIIDKLKERNNNLINLVDENFKLSLEEALDNSLVDKYYYQCKI